jgi:hypothetical protein
MTEYLNWTLLRHRVLNAVSAGEVSCVGGPWIFKRRVSTKPQMARVMNALWHHGYVVLDEDRVINGRVELTREGELLLTWWSEHYGHHVGVSS